MRGAPHAVVKSYKKVLRDAGFSRVEIKHSDLISERWEKPGQGAVLISRHGWKWVRNGREPEFGSYPHILRACFNDNRVVAK